MDHLKSVIESKCPCRERTNLGGFERVSHIDIFPSLDANPNNPRSAFANRTNVTNH